MRTRIKMCGMTRAIDISYAVSLGVDAIGFIFYELSSRAVRLAQVKKLVAQVPAFVDIVGVFIDPDPAFVSSAIEELPLQYLQFHGDETVSFCEQFDRPYVKAISAISEDTICQAMKDYSSASAILLDTPSINRGGTGLVFDWDIIPPACSTPLILAGGLNALNVAGAISTSSPYAVDVCSGIEESPGQKDHKKMSEFVTNVWG